MDKSRGIVNAPGMVKVCPRLTGIGAVNCRPADATTGTTEAGVCRLVDFLEDVAEDESAQMHCTPLLTQLLHAGAPSSHCKWLVYQSNRQTTWTYIKRTFTLRLRQVLQPVLVFAWTRFTIVCTYTRWLQVNKRPVPIPMVSAEMLITVG